MNKTLYKALLLPALLSCTMALTGCLDEEMPTNYATGQQVEKSSDALDKLLNGLAGTLVEYDSYGSNSSSQNDWGYPCQMVIREVMGEDFPVSGSTYDYFSYIADGTSMLTHNTYTYYYYAKIINAANSLIAKAGGTAATSNHEYVGMGLAFRAMSYLDLARMFEYRETGFTELDADANEVWGLTVSIVTDSTTLQASRENPRAPFHKMYRFINNDLSIAEKMLAGYTRTRMDFPDISVVYGLKARFWLEAATRFEKSDADLATLLQHEADGDYPALGITSANDCYAKAAEYALKAMTGYTPVSKSSWFDEKTGFNTSNSAWIWAALQTDKDNINSWYYTWLGTMNSEANFTLSKYGTYRCIGAQLFSEIPDGDWRKKTWVNPDDSVRTGYTTVLDSAGLAALPNYANLKFHPGSGNVDDYQVCLLCDIPLMRMEEMEYIYLEAVAHTQGVATAAAQLQSWTNTYRYTDGSYTCDATDLDSFTDELIRQKRIELWGEGITYFDYKRLGKAVTRTYEGTNFVSTQRLNSKDGYVAPWMNYCIPEYESDYNPATKLNPDPSGVVPAK